MRSERVEVSESAVTAALPAARAAVAAAGLPELLARADPGGFGTTALNIRMLEALADAAALAAAAARVCPPGAPAPWFALILAEDAAARLAALGPCEAPKAAAALPVAQYEDLARAKGSEAGPLVLKDCAGFLRYYKPVKDDDVLQCLYSYFRLLARAAAALGKEPSLELCAPSLKLKGHAVSRAEEPSELLPVSFEDLVGNEDFIAAGRRLAQDVAGFDMKTGQNPKKLRNQILFVLGSPGCGKTATAHAVGRYFLDLCAKAGSPGRVRVIRRTDWASAYQNQSARTLLDIFQNEVFNAPGPCGVYWPDIDTAFAARSDGDLRQEEKNILGTLFGILDGTIGPKNGRWFLMCDANTVNMDEAALSRISQNPIRAYGPRTPEDYVRLLRDIKLRGREKLLPLSAEEWAAVGKRLADAKLSGRAVDHVAGRALTEMEDFEQPDHYYALPYEEKKKLIAELSKPVNAARLLEFIESFCKFEKEAQEKAETDRFLARVKEIRLHLSAQRAAAGL